jgi:selenocysteine lyase/cysteine desulfurase
MGASTTQLIRNLSYALSFPAGSELIVSLLDHEANIAPWVSLAAQQKLTIKWWKPKEESTHPKLLPEDLKELLTEKTVLVTCTHASNILGTIHDIKAIAEAVHSVPGAMLCVDAVSYAPHRRIDVRGLGVDFYAFSWYKVRMLLRFTLCLTPFLKKKYHRSTVLTSPCSMPAPWPRRK